MKELSMYPDMGQVGGKHTYRKLQITFVLRTVLFSMLYNMARATLQSSVASRRRTRTRYLMRSQAKYPYHH
ncbi:hypothetical protein Agabi119p4_5225 [Agaricus bisporus var. burnettii]|uniref:Uncharacterized protein n=1 Tax=Agaricus bisporus var. burnettii TaxID=192524 RepID=A0A8H7F4V8_AGABI|nr:hypothetical protein Agabi119p4_5225 [Agaricus bisporus var. burnettii]